jgi:tRNA dimethylallyltransferase
LGVYFRGMVAKKYLIVIGGATATGKTSLSIQLAQYFQTEILSCDSRQFYREMTIGTAKPDAVELHAASHHFIDYLSIEQDYTVGDFERDALILLEKLFQEKDVLIMVGGSGLFIRALCQGLNEFPEVPNSIREELNNLFEREGIEALQNELKQSDREYYEEVDLQNPVRLIRALGVCRVSGQPFSDFRKQKQKTRFFTPIYVLAEMDREVLYDKINRRVDLMLKKGLVEEAKSLFPHRHLNALQTVGYQEFFEYFEGLISLEEAIELVKRNSRRYAKRQMTWFRKDGFWKGFSSSEVDSVIDYIKSQMEAFDEN